MVGSDQATFPVLVRMVFVALRELFPKIGPQAAWLLWLGAGIFGIAVLPMVVLALLAVWSHRKFLSSQAVTTLFRDRQED
ncbi:MAG: hypothetical protein AMS16_06810 [Planctomycetes bacterium DG_58]|nr:MAG: hypothetical protein AMS16_06810 [Planctomycetes bacterium DG_58]